MAGSAISRLVNDFMNEDEGPCEDGFDNVDPDEIFDRPCDVVLNCWFVSLVVTGKLEEPEFDFNG